MMKVGITGGIGSGKTMACHLFERMGIPVYYADERAKWLMQHQPGLVEGIKGLLGAEAYLSDGRPDRAYIASVVFHHPGKLKALNALVHPAVWQDGENWHKAQAAPYTLKEAALLYETGGHQLMDQMIAVYANQKIRIRRVMDRDGATRQQVLARMRQQMPNLEKARRADFVIKNDGRHSVVRQVWDIHQRLLALGAGELSVAGFAP